MNQVLDIQSMFSAHELDEKAIHLCDLIRGNARFLAWCIQQFVPTGPNQTLALRHLEDCVMRANKGISEEYPIKK